MRINSKALFEIKRIRGKKAIAQSISPNTLIIKMLIIIFFNLK